ncbi:MAG TPA: hypothetical protein VFT55_00920 [Planctomycetota bacterium]|nr:hypothetical protein [Planctomycetota bacterium]
MVTLVVAATLLLGLIAATTGLAWRVAALEKTNADMRSSLEEVLGEVTRIRIEQSTELKGPKGLLEKLRTYAPLVASSRTTDPDFKAAHKEIQNVLRAFQSIGEDAWAPIMARIGELRGDKDFDEARWLLEAAVRVDPKESKSILQQVLLGRYLPSPRLRLQAARMLIDLDKPLAQSLLRQILTTESYRGTNPDRAPGNDGKVLDPSAQAQQGFYNFVVWYLRSEDPQIDDTLLMVLGRIEHDLTTIQECVKELGERRCERAVEPIQKLFKNPPQQNPLFLKYCVDAIHKIQGDAARPWLEEAMRTTEVQSVADHIKKLLGK